MMEKQPFQSTLHYVGRIPLTFWNNSAVICYFKEFELNSAYIVVLSFLTQKSGVIWFLFFQISGDLIFRKCARFLSARWNLLLCYSCKSDSNYRCFQENSGILLPANDRQAKNSTPYVECCLVRYRLTYLVGCSVSIVFGLRANPIKSCL